MPEGIELLRQHTEELKMKIDAERARREAE